MSFHEDFKKEDSVKGGTDRAFGLTVGGILLAIGLVGIYFAGQVTTVLAVLSVVGIILFLLGLFKPGLLNPLNKLWMMLAIVLFKVTNPLVMMIIYLFSVLPIGIIMKILKKDILSLEYNNKESYWVKREPPGPPPESMSNQF